MYFAVYHLKKSGIWKSVLTKSKREGKRYFSETEFIPRILSLSTEKRHGGEQESMVGQECSYFYVSLYWNVFLAQELQEIPSCILLNR